MRKNPIPVNARVSFSSVLFIVGIVFVAFNLRSSITAVGPLIGFIRSSTEMSNTSIGLLTTLPVLAFGIFSTISPKLGKRFGNEVIVFIALVILTIGILLRSTGFIVFLFIGTTLLGLGIACLNVLIIGIIKDKYPEKMGVMTGVYTTSMSVMAAFASGVSIPLAQSLDLGWEKSLALWAVLSGLALILWLPQLSTKKKPLMKSTIKEASIWRSPLAWQVMLFMGFQSSIFYCMIAWIPEILMSRGVDVPTAGWMLTFMQFAGLPATLLIPVLAVHLANQRSIVIGISVLYLVGFLGIYIGGNLLIITLCMLALGIAQGAGISLALTMFGLRTKTADAASELSGMAQSGGYLLAATGPLLMGLLFDTFNSWTPGLLLFTFFVIGMGSFGLWAGRDEQVNQSEEIRLRA